MIVRVWGRINSLELDFTPVEDRPGYWEGIGPKEDIYQDIEIWAQNHLGQRGHLRTTCVIREWSPTTVRLLVMPYKAQLIDLYSTRLLREEAC